MKVRSFVEDKLKAYGHTIRVACSSDFNLQSVQTNKLK
jgi:hypothetical protein